MQNNKTKSNFGENGKKGVKLANGRVVIPANYDEIAYNYLLVSAKMREPLPSVIRVL